jgi:hypothetical protein
MTIEQIQIADSTLTENLFLFNADAQLTVPLCLFDIFKYARSAQIHKTAHLSITLLLMLLLLRLRLKIKYVNNRTAAYRLNGVVRAGARSKIKEQLNAHTYFHSHVSHNNMAFMWQ